MLFVSVYIKEDVSVPLGTSPYDSVAIEDISVEGVAKLLTDLQSHKAGIFNYRPVSLTSIPCKIFEHIIYSTVYKHLESNSISCAMLNMD